MTYFHQFPTSGGRATVPTRFESLSFTHLETFSGKASKTTSLNDIGGAIKTRTDNAIIILYDRKSIRIRQLLRNNRPAETDAGEASEFGE